MWEENGKRQNETGERMKQKMPFGSTHAEKSGMLLSHIFASRLVRAPLRRGPEQSG